MYIIQINYRKYVEWKAKNENFSIASIKLIVKCETNFTEENVVYMPISFKSCTICTISCF